VTRRALVGAELEGDAEKFTRTVYQVVQGGKIPLRLPMGLDAIEILKGKIESLKATLAETASWSADLKRSTGRVALATPV